MKYKDYSFQWNLDGVKESDLKKVRIGISSDYHWGSGWESRKAEIAFKKEVYGTLREAGYDLLPASMAGACPYLINPDNPGTNLYLHPMEFTGYLSENDANTIVRLLKEKCTNTVYEVSLSSHGDKDKAPTYDLDDAGYEKVLEKNITGILKFITEAEKRGIPEYDIGFEFARNFRIDYPDQSSIYSSMDKDISFVNNINNFIRESGISAEEYMKRGDILSVMKEKQEQDLEKQEEAETER